MRKKILTCLIAFSVPLFLDAQEFDLGFDYSYLFDNSEFAASSDRWCSSQTVNANMLTPCLGIGFDRSEKTRHTLFVGVDILHNMGEGFSVGDSFRELPVWYNISSSYGKLYTFSAAIGMYPRGFLEGGYDGVYFRDEVLFYDRNFEGFALKTSSDRFYGELGLDWMGLLGDASNPGRRERFRVLGTAEWGRDRVFGYGARMSFYHYACSPLSPNVIDNHLLEAFVRWSRTSDFLDCEFDLRALQTYQRDRKQSETPSLAFGAISDQSISKGPFSITNLFYLGQDLMPLAGGSYQGVPYGDELLYEGEEFYGTGFDGLSWYDQIALSLHLSSGTGRLNVGISCIFHFGTPAEGMSVCRGNQQMITVRLKL